MYVKIVNGAVVQTQPYPGDGFVFCEEEAYYGQIQDGDGFIDPPKIISDSERKMIGVEFDGVMCSATSRDMYGLSAIKDWVKSGNSTNFEFDNGNKLLLTSDNYAAFESVWAPFRARFF